MSKPWHELDRKEFSKGDVPTIKGTEEMMVEWVTEQLEAMAKAKPDGFELTLDSAYIKKRYNTTNLEPLKDLKDGVECTFTDKQIVFKYGTTLRERIDAIEEYQRKRREQEPEPRRGDS